jgi:Flp pilus assembly pilin Flp
MLIFPKKCPSPHGHALSEYGLIAGLVVIVSIGGLSILGSQVQGLLDGMISTRSSNNSLSPNLPNPNANGTLPNSSLFGDRFGGYDILANSSLSSVVLSNGKTISVPVANIDKLSETLGPNGGTLGIEASVLALIDALEKANPDDPSIPDLKTWATMLHQKAGLQKLADESSIRFAYQAETGEAVQDTYRLVADPWNEPKNPDFQLGGDSSGGNTTLEIYKDRIASSATFDDFLNDIKGLTLGDRASVAGYWLESKFGNNTDLGAIITQLNASQSQAGMKSMDYYNTINMPPELVSPDIFTTLKSWQPNLTTSKTANQSCLLSNTDGSCLKTNPYG